MSTLIIDLPLGCEARTTLTRTSQGLDAHSILFDGEADVIAETDTMHYVDYCEAEIVTLELARLMPELADDASEYAAASDIYCECE